MKKSKKYYENKIKDYFNEFLNEDNDAVADVESLAVYLGMTREELIIFEDDAECGNIIKLAKARTAMIKKQLAFKGKIPAAVLAFDFKNNHGYRDKPEQEAQEINTLVIRGVAEKWGD